MAKKSYALKRGGPKRISISWKLFMRDITVEYDGQMLGTIPNQQTLKDGRTYQLPDGSQLEVKLVRTWLSSELEVLRDGKPLPGSGSDPLEKLKGSYSLLYLIGGLNFALGIATYLFQIEFLFELGIGFMSGIVGGIYLILAFLVQKQFRPALIIALILYGLETILTIFSGLTTGIIVRVIFFIYLARGLGALKEIKSVEKGSEVIPG